MNASDLYRPYNMWRYSHVLKIACYADITDYQFTLAASSSSTTLKMETAIFSETLIRITSRNTTYTQHHQNPVCLPIALT